MSRRTALTALVAAAAGLVLTSGTAAAQQSIGPNQAFSGVLNGYAANAPVYVICPGPIFPTSKGHPIGNQSWQVVLGGPGFTGSVATRIVATFAADSSAPVTFTAYRAPKAIPTSLLLPCSGSGLAVFTPAPASPTARSATVTVRFINLAVAP